MRFGGGRGADVLNGAASVTVVEGDDNHAVTREISTDVAVCIPTSCKTVAEECDRPAAIARRWVKEFGVAMCWKCDPVELLWHERDCGSYPRRLDTNELGEGADGRSLWLRDPSYGTILFARGGLDARVEDSEGDGRLCILGCFCG
jgi:hypothetical protein